MICKVKEEGKHAVYFEGWPFNAFCNYLNKHRQDYSPITRGELVSYADGERVFYFEAINTEQTSIIKAWVTENG